MVYKIHKVMYVYEGCSTRCGKAFSFLYFYSDFSEMCSSTTLMFINIYVYIYNIHIHTQYVYMEFHHRHIDSVTCPEYSFDTRDRHVTSPSDGR